MRALRVVIETLRLYERAVWTGAVLAFLFARHAFPYRDLNTVGAAALRDLALTLLNWALFLMLAIELGRNLLTWIDPPGISQAERIVFGFSMGTASLSLIVLLLGSTSSLTKLALSLILLGLTWTLAPGFGAALREISGLVLGRLRQCIRSEAIARYSCLAILFVGALGLVNSLGPPWDYDGLMYHLFGPRIFLEHEGLFPYPDNWYVNGPFAIELLFTFGMAFGDDVFPKLVHFSFGAFFIIATYLVARRWLSPRTGILASLLLLGVPILPVWAGFAYIDLGWGLYEFLSIAALLVWSKERDRQWLIVAGSCIGAAAASKYLGLIGIGISGMVLLLLAGRRSNRARVRDLRSLGLPILVIAGPWYVRNFIWFGNPFFPLLFGGPGWDSGRLGDYMAYLTSFGAGRRLIDYLLLPLNAYVRHAQFGTVMNSIDIPGVLFPLALIAAFNRSSKALRYLVWIGVARAALWSLGSQQLRFLLPTYPLFAIGAADSVAWISDRFRDSVWRLFLPSLVIGLGLMTAVLQVIVFVKYRPLPAALGYESVESFRLRINGDYPSIKHFLDRSKSSDRLLMIGDARAYLCPDQCIPDPDHFRWAREITRAGNVSQLTRWLHQLGATHVLWSVEDLDFLLQHDPKGIMRSALRLVLEAEQEGCLQAEFTETWSTLYRVSCAP